MVEKYPGWSPYNYTLQNPVKLVDPDGRAPLDTYTINENGKVEHLNDKKYYDENGNEVDKLVSLKNKNSTFVSKGVLGSTETTSFKRTKTLSDGSQTEINEQVQLIDVGNIDNSQSKSLFEFMAKNSKSEFSLQTFKNDCKFIGTSFDSGIEWSASLTIHRNGEMTHHIHSHPGGDLNPSPGDKNTVNHLKNNLGFDIENEIYSPQKDRYKSCDENRVRQLNELIIKVEKE